MNKYYILMKVKSWDTLAIKFLNKEYQTNPDTTSIGFCLIYIKQLKIVLQMEKTQNI